MNEKQAKRLRRAKRRHIDEYGPGSGRQAEFLRIVVVENWHRLNHRQRGRVMARIQARGL